MAGFENQVLLAKNVNFDFLSNPPHNGIITADGQILIGSATTTPNVAITAGNITSTGGSVAVTYSYPNINLEIAGGGQALEHLTGNDSVIVNPDVNHNINILGTTVAAGTIPFQFTGAASNLTGKIQRSQALAAADSTKIGLSNFNSAQFTVDANGFVGLVGSTTHAGILGVHPTTTSGGGTDPVLADASGNISILAGAVAAGTNPARTVSTAVNSLTTQIQISQAIAATDATKIGLSNFDSARFTVDANGFVSTNGTGLGETITGNSGGALSPTGGNWNILGASTAAGTTPVSTSGAVSTLTINVQISQAIASTDATKIGLSAFNNSQFTVDANGFVSTNGNTVKWQTISANQTLVKNNGYICISPGGALSLALPSTASSTIGDIIEVTLDGATSWTITQALGQQIRFSGSQTTSGAGGSIASTAQGDTIKLVYQAGGRWNLISAIGNLTVT